MWTAPGCSLCQTVPRRCLLVACWGCQKLPQEWHQQLLQVLGLLMTAVRLGLQRVALQPVGALMGAEGQALQQQQRLLLAFAYIAFCQHVAGCRGRDPQDGGALQEPALHQSTVNSKQCSNSRTAQVPATVALGMWQQQCSLAPAGLAPASTMASDPTPEAQGWGLGAGGRAWEVWKPAPPRTPYPAAPLTAPCSQSVQHVRLFMSQRRAASACCMMSSDCQYLLQLHRKVNTSGAQQQAAKGLHGCPYSDRSCQIHGVAGSLQSAR